MRVGREGESRSGSSRPDSHSKVEEVMLNERGKGSGEVGGRGERNRRFLLRGRIRGEEERERRWRARRGDAREGKGEGREERWSNSRRRI